MSKVGDLVWAKMKGFSPWPGRVAEPRTASKKKGCQWVYFFGSNNYGWVEEQNIKPYRQYKEQFANVCKSALFKNAVKDIEDYITKVEEDPKYESLFETLLQEKEEERMKTPPPAKKPKKTSSAKRQSSEISRNSTGSIPTKKPRLSSPQLKYDENGASEEQYDEEILSLPPSLSKPESPQIDLNEVPDELKNKNIRPSSFAFGFMGLGIMGSCLVRNLICSGHTVNLWNRSSHKCDNFKIQADQNLLSLVQTHQAPCDVVQNSDIIFSCLADPRSAKEVVIGNCGVIHQADGDNALQNKGYVEMTSIDPDTSKDICNIIESKGGRYLEAQMHGSKKQAEEGNLIILAAGNKSLFDECQTCFKAMGKTVFYLGQVGCATKMNLCLNMTLGIMLMGFTESLVLAERCGLSIKDFLEIFSLSEGANNYLVHKGNTILQKDYSKKEQALEYMQKDLKLCLDMSNAVKQNLPVAAAANESYKHARKLGYDNHDVCVIYRKLKQ